MYKLTLTAGERRAIDWIGDRYAHGLELYRLLWSNCEQEPDDQNWDADADITFHIPEHVAWDICSIVEEDNLACFDGDLVHKLLEFTTAVV